jgi:UDP-N-acetyl-D-mannosaminuronic acid dehydrogenase
MTTDFESDVGVIGGAGRVGLALSLTFADCGLKTVIYDIDSDKVQMIREGQMPFFEHEASDMLTRTLQSGTLQVEDKPNRLRECQFLICIVGTPVDEHLNPAFTGIHRALDGCRDQFRDGQILVLRSTVFPGTSQHVQQYFRDLGVDVKVSFCPERVAQGQSVREFRTLPQIISAFDEGTLAEVERLFRHFVPDVVVMPPMEAELCKLMTNSWRYLQFAAVNQFYMIATSRGLDFDRILHGCRHDYPRMAGMPGPGFSAGPCLVKDTMQLAAFSHNQFLLGHAAMLINEGLPAYLIERARSQLSLREAVAGILGLAFKAESDDPRDSLSYKLRKLLVLETASVLVTDPYVQDPDVVPVERLLEEADVVFVATPHKVYRELVVPADTVLLDVWNCLGTQAPS